MRKYFLVFKTTLSEYFIYRTNFLLWRLRNVVFYLSLLFFWQAIFQNKATIFDYSKEQMLTYILGVAVLRALVFGSRTADLAGLIKSGEVIGKYLLRPWRITGVWFAKDLAAKVLDLLFLPLEFLIISQFVPMKFFLPSSWLHFLLFVGALLLAIATYFWFSFLLSILAFWLDDVWAPRWLFGVVLLEFCSGVFFPLDVLPDVLQKIINLTPFPYLIYFPLRIYLGQVSMLQGLKISGILLFWLLFLMIIVHKAWEMGRKGYSTYGG